MDIGPIRSRLSLDQRPRSSTAAFHAKRLLLVVQSGTFRRSPQGLARMAHTGASGLEGPLAPLTISIAA
jgi:hypothetical protein